MCMGFCPAIERLVRVGQDDRPIGNQAKAPDGVPGEGVLTTEVEDPTVTEFHREGDGVPEGVVTDKHGLVVVGRGGRSVQCRVDLGRLDEHNVPQTADLTKGEVAGGGVLRDLNELRRVTKPT